MGKTSQNQATEHKKDQKKKDRGPPPDDYVCAACQKSGHWVTECTQRVRSLAKKKRRAEAMAAGGEDVLNAKKKAREEQEEAERNPKFRDPTPEDIAKANSMMPVIKMSKAPDCKCGIKARPRKCRDPKSPWHNEMVWWCAKDKTDASNCGYARRFDQVEKERNKQVFKKTRKKKA